MRFFGVSRKGDEEVNQFISDGTLEDCTYYDLGMFCKMINLKGLNILKHSVCGNDPR